ncbi:MAG TPA: phosphatase PAP2 family protein [Actinomycetales bacterium]|nr:phosphatase PAP2 family protein [Actinomycetales bacterium]
MSGPATASPPHATRGSGSGVRPLLWRELAGGLVVFGLYLLVDSQGGPERRAAADRHAQLVIDLQRSLHLDVERPLNAWLAPHQVLSTIANYEYAFTYVVSALALLTWLYVRAPADYRPARSSFVLLNLLGITCFWLFPMTPPRLMTDLGLVDTVTRGGTIGSWGMPLVTHANQLAAMPSLHVAWALWVSVVLARQSRGLGVQVVSAVHVAVTVLVILATANHYLVDALAAVPFVWVSVAVVDRWCDPGRRGRVPATDAFFLHAEAPRAPQHVGGVVVLAPGGGPSVDEVRDLVRSELGRLPRFTQRLDGGTRWRRPRWVDAGPLDWSWHVTELSVPGATRDEAVAAVGRVVGDLASRLLPRDRPMWRIVLVRAPEVGRSTMLLLVHHCVADGIGTVAQAVQLFRPRIDLVPDGRREVPALKQAAATVVGLAQLATDGRPAARVPPPHDATTDFCCSWLPLDRVRDVARAHEARVTDLLLCLVVAALQREQPSFVARLEGRLRVAVPLMVRQPDSAAEGNVTAAVMVDLPVDIDVPADLLTEVRRRTGPLHTPTRALASRFVMAKVLELTPEPGLRWFARTVYSQAFLQAIVSNMPGPRQQLDLVGVPIEDVVPIIPLAPGTPLAVGALSWGDQLGVGLVTRGETLDAGRLSTAMAAVLDELDERPPSVELPDVSGARPAPTVGLTAVPSAQDATDPKQSARNILARDSGESSAPPRIDRSWPTR